MAIYHQSISTYCHTRKTLYMTIITEERNERGKIELNSIVKEQGKRF